MYSTVVNVIVIVIKIIIITQYYCNISQTVKAI